jgi:cell division protein FtsN
VVLLSTHARCEMQNRLAILGIIVTIIVATFITGCPSSETDNTANSDKRNVSPAQKPAAPEMPAVDASTVKAADESSTEQANADNPGETRAGAKGCGRRRL